MNIDWRYIREQQIAQLEALQPSNRDILVQVQSDRLEPWTPLKQYKEEKRIAPIKFRSVLENELIYEIDNDDWKEMAVQSKRIYDWLREHKAPISIIYTGNKSLHLRTFFDPTTLKTDPEVAEGIKEYGVDVLKEVRLFFYNLVKEKTGTDPDRSMFSWGSSTKGHMERMEGSIHEKTSKFCSLLERIPEEKPSDYPLKFMDPTQRGWDVSEFAENINAMLKGLLDQLRKEEPGAQSLAFLEGVEFNVEEIPCIKKLLDKGLPKGHRHEGCYSIATLFKRIGIPIERAKEAVELFLTHSEDFDEKKLKAELKNTEDIYANKDKLFSCGYMPKEHPELCDGKKDKSVCPVWKEIRFIKENEKEKKGKKEGEEKEKAFHRSHLEKDGKLYLEVFTKNQEFKFACLDNDRNVKIVDEVVVGEHKIKPAELPMKEGNYYVVVQMPDEGIAVAPLLETDELLKEMEQHLKRYCDLAELDLKMSVYYALFTWFYEKVNTCAVLRFIGDTGKGKSRLAKAISDLCFYPLSVSGSGSLSGAMRQNELWRGTMVIDESDFKEGKEGPWTKYINLGFERGKYFTLSDKQNPRFQEWFDPFSPKIVAMREPFRDNATEGRLISISPYETTSEDIPVNLPEDYQRETIDLRNKIARFVMEHWNDVDVDRLIDFKGLGLEPRLRQLAMPISIIFQLWDGGEEEFKSYLIARQREIKKIRAQSWEGSIFNYVYSLAKGEIDVGDEFSAYVKDGELEAITPSMVAKVFNKSTKQITEALTSIGFEVEHDNITTIRRNGEEEREVRRTIRKYTIPNERTWKEILQRYYYTDGVEEKEDLTIPEILKGKHYGVCRTVTSVTSVTKTEPKQKSVTDVTDVTHSNTPESKNELIMQNVNSLFVEKTEANLRRDRGIGKNETDQPEDLLKNDPQVIGYENKLREIFSHSRDRSSFVNIAQHETGLDNAKLEKVWEELGGSSPYINEIEQTGDLSKTLMRIAKECGATTPDGASAAEVIRKAVEKGIKKDEAIQFFHDLQISGLIRECALGRFVLEGSP